MSSAQERLTDALYGLGWSTVKKLPEPVAVNGLVERAERLVISLVACGLAGLHKFGVPGIQWLLPIALWIVAVGSLVTLIQRVVTVRRESAEAEAAAAPPENASQGSEAAK